MFVNNNNQNNARADRSMFTIRGDLDGGKGNQEFVNIRQFIGLLIAKEEFLLPIEVTNEIIMMNQLTFVPRAPNFIEGVINLRGTIVPAINLRKMLGMSNEKPTAQSRIIIAHYDEVMIGLIVDGITYVISVPDEQLQQQVLPGKGTSSELISMISKRGSQVNGVIDIAKVLSETGINYQAQDEEEEESH